MFCCWLFQFLCAFCCLPTPHRQELINSTALCSFPVGAALRQASRICSRVWVYVILSNALLKLNSPIVSFLAIVPLAKVRVHSTPSLSTHRSLSHPQLLAFAADELSIRVGETLAGLLETTLVRTPFRLKIASSWILRLTRARVCLQGNT